MLKFKRHEDKEFEPYTVTIEIETRAKHEELTKMIEIVKLHPEMEITVVNSSAFAVFDDDAIADDAIAAYAKSRAENAVNGRASEQLYKKGE